MTYEIALKERRGYCKSPLLWVRYTAETHKQACTLAVEKARKAGRILYAGPLPQKEQL